MSILKIRGANNQFQAVQTVKGDKGDPGELSTELKLTLLNLAKKVTWIDNLGERYYQDLWNALYGDDYQENFSRVGTPTIENGILTSSSSGWIQMPSAFDPGLNPWELTVKLYRPSFPAAYEELVVSSGVLIKSVWQSANSKLHLYSENGAISDGAKQKAIPKESWRWVKIAFDGTGHYDYGISSDGATYTWLGGYARPFTGSSLESSTPIKAGAIAFGSSNSRAKFDLREINIKVNGQVVWRPYVLE